MKFRPTLAAPRAATASSERGLAYATSGSRTTPALAAFGRQPSAQSTVGSAQGPERFFCSATMKSFCFEGEGTPEGCPESHREGDPAFAI